VLYQYNGETCIHLFDVSKGNSLKKLCLLQAQDTCVLEDISPNADKTAAASIVGGDWLITGLHYDNSFRLYKASIRPLRLALKQTVKFHTDVVCCLGVLADCKLVTGSKDGVLALWEVSLGRQESVVKYRATLRGHSSEILKIEGNADLVLVCSLSRDGLLLLHDLRSGELFNSVRPPFSQVNTFALSSQGLLAVSVDNSAPRVVIYSTNGELGRGPLQDMNFLHFDWYSTMKASRDIAVDSVFQMQFNLEGDYLMAASPSFFIISAVYEPLHLPFLYPARQHLTAFALDQDESRVLVHLHRTTFVLISKAEDNQRRRMNGV
jgi:WD40 repeat protein